MGDPEQHTFTISTEEKLDDTWISMATYRFQQRGGTVERENLKEGGTKITFVGDITREQIVRNFKARGLTVLDD